MLMRILAVLGAILLIGALAIATLAPPDLSLGQALFTLDRELLNMVQAGTQRRLSPWIWEQMVVPLLVRPAWLVPAALGLICAGFSATLASRRSVAQSRRRRS